ncbi:hypothetical protein EJ07DRAFT_183073 [Lizonia empirigonia]|nr:hypothetical protein EJ07DRAFT_183073 [Lizonia empirigonia]
MAGTDVDAKPLKRECVFQDSPQRKRTKQRQHGSRVKLESENIVSRYDSDDSEGVSDIEDGEVAGPTPPSTSTPSPPPITLLDPFKAQRLLGTGDSNNATSLIAKMQKITNLEARARSCREEMARIADISKTLEEQAPDLLKDGRAKWLLAYAASLGGANQALHTVLDHTTKRQQARKRKLAKKQQEQRAKERQLEVKRLSNRQQIKSEEEVGVLQVDLTKGPEVVEIKPSLKPRSLVVLKKTEERFILKKDILEPEGIEALKKAKEGLIMEKDVRVGVEPGIKLEPTIKLEEE